MTTTTTPHANPTDPAEPAETFAPATPGDPVRPDLEPDSASSDPDSANPDSAHPDSAHPDSAHPDSAHPDRANPDSAAATQRQISDEIQAIEAAYQSSGETETQPRLDYPPYRSSILRHPTKDLRHADPETIELWAPCFGHRDVAALESDLTIQHNGDPVGERIVVTGKIVDGNGRPVRHQLVEIWQANAAGRYIHKRDQHPAPIDPNFTGVGRCLTDGDGNYRFQTIKPGPYPWKNHYNAWRPAHIHFSLFGTDFTQRMVTQMYFPGDPLFALDPIYQTITDQQARDRLVATYDHGVTQHEWSTGYRWDIVLTGSRQTWTEPEGEQE